jgi:hypothetical protein
VIRNNFPYRSFPRFEMEFELKFREASMSWNQRKFTGISWNFGFWWNLASKLLVTPYCQKKSISIKIGSESWIPLKKGNSFDFMIVWILNFILNSAFWFRLILEPNYLLMTLTRVSIARGVTISTSTNHMSSEWKGDTVFKVSSSLLFHKHSFCCPLWALRC